jgi:hypothetical protein
MAAVPEGWLGRSFSIQEGNRIEGWGRVSVFFRIDRPSFRKLTLNISPNCAPDGDENSLS